MLSDGERRRCSHWSGDYGPSAESHSVKELFEEQAARTPDATGRRLRRTSGCRSTSSTSARTASRGSCSDAGVGPGTFVGIMMDKSLELVAAVLAVIKAGGAYIPIDPRLPAGPHRVHARGRAAAGRADRTRSCPDSRRRRGDGDRDLDGTPGERAETTNPPTVSQPDDLAYVIYTSGSTGRPKGAMITQPQPRERPFRLRRGVPAARADGHLQMASFSFDVFTGDLIRSLLAGANARALPARGRRRPGAPLRADACASASTRPSSCRRRATLLFE